MYPRANKHAMDAHLEVRRLRGGRGCSTLLGPQSPFLAQTTYNSTGLSPKRHCGTKWVKVEHFVFGRLLLSLDQMFISRKRYTPCSVFGRKTKKKKKRPGKVESSKKDCTPWCELNAFYRKTRYTRRWDRPHSRWVQTSTLLGIGLTRLFFLFLAKSAVLRGALVIPGRTKYCS